MSGVGMRSVWTKWSGFSSNVCCRFAIHQRPQDMLTTYDRAWTALGLPLAVSCISLLFLARTGALPLVSTTNMGDALRITVGYWGLLVTSSGLSCLGIIALRYLAHRPTERCTEPPWPRFVLIEEEGRDAVLTRALFCFIVATPVLSWVAFLLRYFDSQVSPWAATNVAESLGDGFFSSRFAVFMQQCTDEPCWRIHPPNGHQYVGWLSDPVILGTAIVALWIWALWYRRSRSARP